MTLAFIVFSSLPSNFIERKMIAIFFGVLSIIAFITKIGFKQFDLGSKIVLTIAIIAGCLQLFI
ncbi:hypothetical protein LZ578_06895 [Jeotgalibaca sp. MA1X17-3]|uniref:hypothetical protein n=1 Tax=Jeotgalibaca sp. MA1X17-3 TaxID=2908211 RepID=UPI001F3A019A|nr:hypothetical protein [Jeotgalibaca sp. MA1X17-3]UJF14751.1 hypothetical protein LZ578_06895 [Jeotgalibaca sp. MA1X17-3]